MNRSNAGLVGMTLTLASISFLFAVVAGSAWLGVAVFFIGGAAAVLSSLSKPPPQPEAASDISRRRR